MRLPEVGELFEDRYQLRALLGEGGFARVFRAEDLTVHRDVALKVLAPRAETYSRVNKGRFLREARLIAGLKDPHTITMFDFGMSDDGVLFMAFEYIDGEDLGELMRREGRLSVDVTVHIMDQLSSSLREAHEAGILHRDIKPANVLVYEYDGDPYRVKMLDFGLAKPVEPDPREPHLTEQGSVAGTPRYMSPEHVNGEGPETRSDIYSLGLIGYELLTGRAAVNGPNLPALMRAHITGPPLRVPEDAAPAPVREIIDKMVHRDIELRYDSIDDVRRDLRSLPSESDASPEPEPPAPVRSNNHVVVGILVAVAVLGVIGALWQRPSRAPAPVARIATPMHTRSVASEHRFAPPAEPDLAQPRSASPRSPGCGKKAPFVGRGMLDTMDGLTKTSSLTFVPRAYDPNVPHAALLLLHGDARAPSEFLDQTKLDEIADEHGVVLIAPQGPLLPWRDASTLINIPTLVAETAERVCIDPRRVYALGHGAGGRAVDYLACQGWLAGIAMTEYRPADATFACEEVAPTPRIRFSAMDSRRSPVVGGTGCGGTQSIPLEAAESTWLTKNGCDASSRREHDRQKDDVCWTWDCDAPMVSCHLRGGSGWPGSPMRDADLLGCDDQLIPYRGSDAAWAFFASLPVSSTSSPLW